MFEVVIWALLIMSGLGLVGTIAVIILDAPECVVLSVSVLLISLFGLGICSSIATSDERKRLMQQCMDTGKQEFECVSLLREPSSTIIPIPMIIPIR